MSSTDEKSLLASAEDTAGAPPKYDATGYDSLPTAPYYQPVVQQPVAHIVTVGTVPQTVIVQQPIARPPSYMWLSCLVYWCCNWIAGCVAFGLSMASSSAADENRMEEARNYGKASLVTSLVGVVLGVITIIVLIILISNNDINDNNTM